MNMPRKARRLAMKSVLSQKVADNELVVLDQLTLAAPKTKDLKAVLDSANINGKVLVDKTRISCNIRCYDIDHTGKRDYQW